MSEGENSTDSDGQSGKPSQPSQKGADSDNSQEAPSPPPQEPEQVQSGIQSTQAGLSATSASPGSSLPPGQYNVLYNQQNRSFSTGPPTYVSPQPETRKRRRQSPPNEASSGSSGEPEPHAQEYLSNVINGMRVALFESNTTVLGQAWEVLAFLKEHGNVDWSAVASELMESGTSLSLDVWLASLGQTEVLPFARSGAGAFASFCAGMQNAIRYQGPELLETSFQSEASMLRAKLAHLTEANSQMLRYQNERDHYKSQWEQASRARGVESREIFGENRQLRSQLKESQTKLRKVSSKTGATAEITRLERRVAHYRTLAQTERGFRREMEDRLAQGQLQAYTQQQPYGALQQPYVAPANPDPRMGTRDQPPVPGSSAQLTQPFMGSGAFYSQSQLQPVMPSQHLSVPLNTQVSPPPPLVYPSQTRPPFQVAPRTHPAQPPSPLRPLSTGRTQEGIPEPVEPPAPSAAEEAPETRRGTQKASRGKTATRGRKTRKSG